MIERPEWQIQGVRIDQIDFSKATLGVNAQITNPNHFDVTLQQVHYRLYLKETLIAQGEKTESFELPGHGAADVWLPVEVSLSAARQILPLLKNNPEDKALSWRIEGEGTLKAFGIEKILPFKKEGGEQK
jgi:LEA14-like dessication related protein